MSNPGEKFRKKHAAVTLWLPRGKAQAFQRSMKKAEKANGHKIGATKALDWAVDAFINKWADK